MDAKGIKKLCAREQEIPEGQLRPEIGMLLKCSEDVSLMIGTFQVHHFSVISFSRVAKTVKLERC